jgi:hypothetical protein
VVIFLGVLGFVGAAIVGMLLSEVLHECADALARFLVGRAVLPLPTDMREVRRAEWLAELAAMEGLHILRVFRALGYGVASVRLRERRKRVISKQSDGKTTQVVRVDVNVLAETIHTKAVVPTPTIAMGAKGSLELTATLEASGTAMKGRGTPGVSNDWLREISDDDPTQWYGGGPREE